MTVRGRRAGSGKGSHPERAWWFFRLLFLPILLPPVLFLPPSPATAGERAHVLAVIDGDTILVGSDQDLRTIRLIGIDAPEKGHPARPKEFGSDESAKYLSDLCEGKEILLEPDGEDTDSYGRYLRYVFLPGPERRLLNLDLVRHGFARVLRPFPFSRREEFERAEEEARENDRGVWEDGGMAELRWLRKSEMAPVLVYPASGRKFAVVFGDRGKPGVEREELGNTIRRILGLSAENAAPDFAGKAERAGFRPLSAAGATDASPAGRREAREPAGNARPAGETVPWERARSYIGREVTVEGKIVRTYRGKNILFLNFHPNWKKYLSVVIFGKDLPGFPDNPETFYRNKALRVRGTVTLHKDRPEIVVTSPAAITVVGDTGN
ncbi:MAG: thermonuclease family protein [Candidatus Deferrimicrobiaceae bacterium]